MSIDERLKKIYPLTVVRRRFGGYAVLNAHPDCEAASDLAEDESLAYGDSAREYMDRKLPWIQHGLGQTLSEALDDYDGDRARIDEWNSRPRKPLDPETEKVLVEAACRLVGGAVGFDLVPVAGMTGPAATILYLDSPNTK